MLNEIFKVVKDDVMLSDGFVRLEEAIGHSRALETCKWWNFACNTLGPLGHSYVVSVIIIIHKDLI